MYVVLRRPIQAVIAHSLGTAKIRSLVSLYEIEHECSERVRSVSIHSGTVKNTHVRACLLWSTWSIRRKRSKTRIRE